MKLLITAKNYIPIETSIATTNNNNNSGSSNNNSSSPNNNNNNNSGGSDSNKSGDCTDLQSLTLIGEDAVIWVVNKIDQVLKI